MTEYENIGVVGYDFDQLKNLDVDDKVSRPYLKLLQHLWPGEFFYFCDSSSVKLVTLTTFSLLHRRLGQAKKTNE